MKLCRPASGTIVKYHSSRLNSSNTFTLSPRFCYQQTPDQRKGQVYNLKDKWGDLFILPNDDYGDWENYLYYQYRLDHKGVPPSDLKIYGGVTEGPAQTSG